MDNLIERLDTWLAQNRADYYRQLEPGLTQEQIEELESTLGNTLPDEMRALLMWRNGQSSRNFKSIYYNYMLIGADDIAEIVEMNNEMLAHGQFNKPNWWDPQWVPFMDNGAGDYYCIDFAGTFDGVPGQIIEFNHDYEGRSIQHRNFRHWLQTLVDALEQGALEDDEYGIQPTEEFDALYALINPGYPIRKEAG